MPDRPCLCEESSGMWCPLHGRTPQSARWASRPWQWITVAALIAVTALIAAGCTDATPTPSPAPPATAPEGDGGGKTGGTP